MTNRMHLRKPHKKTAPDAFSYGFTMVELLIVITIIAVLATIAIRVVGGFITTGKEAQTKATIKKIHGLLDDRLQAFNRLNLRGREIGYLPQADNDLDRAKVLMRKGLLRANFLQSWTEFKTFDPTRWAKVTGTKTDANNGADSAEVLYYTLTEGSIFGVPAVGSDAFSTSEVQDTDGDGKLEFVDGWGKPLRFYRWPTRLIRPDGFNFSTGKPNPITDPQYGVAKMLIQGLTSSKDDLNIDPEDPLSRTTTTTWSNAATFETEYHTPSTYHTFLIVSIGPDEALGLKEPTDDTTVPNNAGPGRLGGYDSTDAAVLDALTDNITSHNSKAGGK